MNNYEQEQAKLSAAFDLVKPKSHWKAPISAKVPADADLDLIHKAIIHFTGSVPCITPVLNKQSKVRWYRIRAEGYWAAIGS